MSQRNNGKEFKVLTRAISVFTSIGAWFVSLMLGWHRNTRLLNITKTTVRRCHPGAFFAAPQCGTIITVLLDRGGTAVLQC